MQINNAYNILRAFGRSEGTTEQAAELTGLSPQQIDEINTQSALPGMAREAFGWMCYALVL